MFCKVCGSTLGGYSANVTGGLVCIMLGTLDDDPCVKASSHIYVGSKAPWYEITDSLPQQKERGPSMTNW
jgi:hypothetical protein